MTKKADSIEPKPKSERAKRTEWPKKPKLRDEICADIDAAMHKNPKDMDALLRLLMEFGYEVKQQKHIALRKSGQRFIRLDSLVDGYKTADLIAELASPRKRKLSLQIDIQKKLQEGKGVGYERWAKVFNLKQAAEALLYLQEHGIDNYEELAHMSAEAMEQFNVLSQEIKVYEARLNEIADLKKAITTYSKTRDIYVTYRQSGYSKKFLAKYESEINLHKAAKEKFDALGLEKLPRVSELSAEYGLVLAKKKAAYSRYKEVRRDMGDLLIAKQNVDLLLSDDSKKTIEHEQKR